MRRDGFSLIELIIVTAIIAILAVAGLPKFFDVRDNAQYAMQKGVVGAVRSGIMMSRGNDMLRNGAPGVYPNSLELGNVCCFGNVLVNPIPDWSTNDNITYSYNGTGDTFNYDSTNGTFIRN